MIVRNGNGGIDMIDQPMEFSEIYRRKLVRTVGKKLMSNTKHTITNVTMRSRRIVVCEHKKPSRHSLLG